MILPAQLLENRIIDRYLLVICEETDFKCYIQND